MAPINNNAPLRVSVKSKSFVNYDEEKNEILHNIQFAVRSTELVVITGPSGCGKRLC